MIGIKNPDKKVKVYFEDKSNEGWTLQKLRGTIEGGWGRI